MLIYGGSPNNKGESVCYTHDLSFFFFRVSVCFKPELEARQTLSEAVTAACNKSLSKLVA